MGALHEFLQVLCQELPCASANVRMPTLNESGCKVFGLLLDLEPKVNNGDLAISHSPA